MIIRKGQPKDDQDEKRTKEYGPYQWLRYSDAGGLTQYGAYVVTLLPGSRSSNRHWHEQEDEFLYMLSGEATVIENDGPHVIHPGDAACWPAGTANAHHVVNRSDAPCTFLIVGTRPTHDICHYPDLGHILYTEGDTWRITREDGTLLKGGKMEGT